MVRFPEVTLAVAPHFQQNFKGNSCWFDDIRKSDHNEILARPGGVKFKRYQEGLDTKL